MFDFRERRRITSLPRTTKKGNCFLGAHAHSAGLFCFALSHEMVTICSLPENVLETVFLFLSAADLIHCSRVCRYWKKIAERKRLWKNVDLRPSKMPFKWLWLLVKQYLGYNLKNLQLEGQLKLQLEELTRDMLMNLKQRCPNLKQLCISTMDLNCIAYSILPPSLETLELSFCVLHPDWFSDTGIPEDSFKPPRIHHLIVKNMKDFSDKHLVHICSRVSLSTLIISGKCSVTDYGIKMSAAALSDVTHLKLTGYNVTEDSLSLILGHIQKVLVLELSFFRFMYPDSLSCLSGHKTLCYLCLDYCLNLSYERLVSLCSTLPALLSLDLQRSSFSSEELQIIRAALPKCTVLIPPNR
ncbi:F-box/LRR-repeat protein 12-like [Protopterus annectens]|uniref:F-box/LRR-repeat protein 12-like n=1 Tax=Protopterus annectens TaxID=7888 RepID=UPI001CFA1218|nr:F-box/LRR-repeat protein 12-like [Protopterus annectens]